MVNVKPEGKQAIVAAGEVDASFDLYTSYAIWEKVLGKGEVGHLLWADYGLPIYGHTYFVNNDLIKKNPKLIERFLRATHKGWRDAKANPAASIDAMVEQVPGLDRATLLATMPAILDLCVTERSAKHGLGWIEPELMQKTIDITFATAKPDKPLVSGRRVHQRVQQPHQAVAAGLRQGPTAPRRGRSGYPWRHATVPAFSPRSFSPRPSSSAAAARHRRRRRCAPTTFAPASPRCVPAERARPAGWAIDIYAAFDALRIEPSTSNICAVLAVAEQESTYRADPAVPGLGRIARDEIDRRAERAGMPKLAGAGRARAALARQPQLQRAHRPRETEKELSDLFEDFIGRRCRSASASSRATTPCAPAGRCR